MTNPIRARLFGQAAVAAMIAMSLGGGCKKTPAPTPVLAAISLASSTAVGVSTVQGTVTLSSAAPSGGALVILSSANTAVATVPANVTVAAGNTSAPFVVTTKAVAAATPVVITGAFGANVTTTLTVTNGLTASFTVISPSRGVNGCMLNTGGATLDCAFNATASSGPIVSYTWTTTIATNVFEQPDKTVTIATPSTNGCGLFTGQTGGGANTNLQMIVRLRVTDANGNVAEVTNNNVAVTPRAGSCGF